MDNEFKMSGNYVGNLPSLELKKFKGQPKCTPTIYFMDTKNGYSSCAHQNV
jgi:hypothetical protein